MGDRPGRGGGGGGDGLPVGSRGARTLRASSSLMVTSSARRSLARLCARALICEQSAASTPSSWRLNLSLSYTRSSFSLHTPKGSAAAEV